MHADAGQNTESPVSGGGHLLSGQTSSVTLAALFPLRYTRSVSVSIFLHQASVSQASLCRFCLSDTARLFLLVLCSCLAVINSCLVTTCSETSETAAAATKWLDLITILTALYAAIDPVEQLVSETITDFKHRLSDSTSTAVLINL